LSAVDASRVYVDRSSPSSLDLTERTLSRVSGHLRGVCCRPEMSPAWIGVGPRAGGQGEDEEGHVGSR
jgi:hypothetical protein